MKPCIGATGYPQVTLFTADGQYRTEAVHRLVTIAFLGPPPTKRHQVNHIDHTRTNNVPSNLEWVTPAENIQHKFLR